MNKPTKQEEIYDLVRQIPKGKVTTYGRIAKVIGINPRYVGYVLHQNPYEGEVPCHRVVSAGGRTANTFAFGGGGVQREMLVSEDVTFSHGRVDKCCIIEM
jgi:methylated-DNA-protein-cysteine methyltransferase-like protein